MEQKTLYRYNRPAGGITVSPIKPAGESQMLIRLIADEGKILTNGTVETTCIDTDNAEGWTEIDAPVEAEFTVS